MKDFFVSSLHKKYLPESYFCPIAAVPRVSKPKNHRRVDMAVVQFEDTLVAPIVRDAWALPIPNREAAFKSLSRYAKPILAMSEQQVLNVNRAWLWTERHFGPYMGGSRVKGIAEVIAGLDVSTSPGFPWTRKWADKATLLHEWTDFSTYLEDDWVRLEQNNYVAVFGNSLKEEIRPMAKVLDNNIRAFTAGPIEMTIHGNRLFQDMNEKFYASHLQSASSVGFSPWRGGWNRLYQKLLKHPKGFALDESQYDSSLRQYMMWGCALFRWHMLSPVEQTPENLSRIKVYYRNLVNTVIMTSDGVFVMKQGGNPSGSINTISDNTLILFTLLSYAWIELSPIEKCTYDCFMQETAIVLCGDDNTWTVSEEAMLYFNARSVSSKFSELGVVTTSLCYEPRVVAELDYLSARTTFMWGLAVPIYDRSKILTSLLYSHAPENPSLTLVRACALLRVGWADYVLRGYLKDLIFWLVARFGPVLSGSEEWRVAISQFPVDEEIDLLFTG